jgi:chromosome segregation ATPase
MKYAPPLPLAVALFALIASVACLASGCSGRTEELEKQNAALQQQNKDLAQNMTSQDEYIDDVVTAINQLYMNIEAARASEKNLLTESKGIEGTKARSKQEVRKDLLKKIEAVNGNLREDYKKLNELEQRLRSSKKQYAALQKTVENLRKTLEEREATIASLE